VVRETISAGELHALFQFQLMGINGASDGRRLNLFVFFESYDHLPTVAAAWRRCRAGAGWFALRGVEPSWIGPFWLAVGVAASPAP
jgi:hypothetical protein